MKCNLPEINCKLSLQQSNCCQMFTVKWKCKIKNQSEITNFNSNNPLNTVTWWGCDGPDHISSSDIPNHFLATTWHNIGHCWKVLIRPMMHLDRTIQYLLQWHIQYYTTTMIKSFFVHTYKQEGPENNIPIIRQLKHYHVNNDFWLL